MNTLNAIGRVGKDAVVRETKRGTKVASFSLAVDSGWGDRKQTNWWDCSVWGKRGEAVSDYIKKGSQLGVTGEPGTREHEGKTYLTLSVQDVTLIGGKEVQAAPLQSSPAPAPGPADGDFKEDDIPF